jgi:GNAT superfamily N-acetyltransferase
MRSTSVDNLCDLLIDAVEGGAFGQLHGGAEAPGGGGVLAGLDRRHTPGATHLLRRARGLRLLGAVRLHPALKPNQPHRADVAKMLVLRSARRRGIASKLLEALETRARQLGRTLLTLDTAAGSTAEPLYRGRGYQFVGEIPGYGFTTDGRLESTIIYYKQLT